jgi:hypothetical protein
MIIAMSQEVGEWHVWNKWIKVNQDRIQLRLMHEEYSMYVVGDKSYMYTTMVEIIFLIPEGRYSHVLIPR